MRHAAQMALIAAICRLRDGLDTPYDKRVGGYEK
jgi:hypothetical protein